MYKKGFDSLDKLIERANKVMGKKLTTKDRKKMKKSTFCGPGRSFPVPDCKHAAVAKAYLGKAKFSSSTKKKIAACINRKAKTLGCDVSKKAKADSEQALFDDPIFEATKLLVEKSIEEPGLDMEWDHRRKPRDCECEEDVTQVQDDETETIL